MGSEGPHHHLCSALLTSDLPSVAFLSVEVVHPRFKGVYGQTGVDVAWEEDHCLGLLGVCLETHTVTEDIEGVEGLLEEG